MNPYGNYDMGDYERFCRQQMQEEERIRRIRNNQAAQMGAVNWQQGWQGLGSEANPPAKDLYEEQKQQQNKKLLLLKK